MTSTVSSLGHDRHREHVEPGDMEKNRYHPRLRVPEPVGMFGTADKQQKDIETTYGKDRYQGVGEADGRF